MIDRLYYRVQPDSPIMAVIGKVKAENKVASDAWSLFEQKHGAVDGVHRGGWLLGLRFGGDAPTGWKPKNGYCIPDKRTAAGKKLYREMGDLPRAHGPLSFSDLLANTFSDNGYSRYADGHIWWTTFREKGDITVLFVPIGLKQPPPGCTEMLPSEVLALFPVLAEDAA